uniref:Fibrinogen C-terminal domain-containing protein n=1 Tax=Cyclopterus lumpus TaxID=8103 RepID=A0A8C3A866_CYCLU
MESTPSSLTYTGRHWRYFRFTTLIKHKDGPPTYSSSFRDMYAICGSLKSRLYNIKDFVSAQAKCDMETTGGGWTVIQNRRDGSLDFNRTWQEYREGFGSPQGEHWLGNTALHALTSTGQHQLRIELEDWHQQKRHATYNNFKVASEAQR